MTIKKTPSRIQYSATALQVLFIYPFEIFNSNDLIVDLNGSILIESTQYSITGVGDDDGGTVTLISPSSSGDIVTLYRDIDLERLSDYAQKGSFLASEVNQDYDRIWAAIQQQDDSIGSSVRPKKTDPILNDSNTEIADLSTRAGKVLGFANDGTFDYRSFGESGGEFIDAATTATMTGLSG